MRFRYWLSIPLSALLVLGLAMPASSALNAPTSMGVHPSVAAQPEIGRGIDDMAVLDGRLYLGNGDYTANTGPIDLAYFDLATGEPGVSATAPTEEVNTLRTFDGHLFAPWVDPTGWGGAVNGGFTSDVGGWHNEFTFPAGHVYDYTQLDDSRFLAGAIAYGGAGVWQSDAGGPWRLVREENSPGGATGWERFYWAITMNGKVYVQAKHKGGTIEMPDGALFDLWSWDGTRWKKLRASVGGVTAGHQIEVFRGRAYYGNSVFTGTRTVRSGVPIIFVRDWYNDGDHLYAIGSDGTLARTDGSGWENLGQVGLPEGVVAYSVAVVSGEVYVGCNTGLVLRAGL